MKKSLIRKAKESNVAPVVSQEGVMKGKDYDAMAFINFNAVIETTIEGAKHELRYYPKGAVIPRKWTQENPVLWENIQNFKGNLADRIVAEYKVVKGDELKRIELDKLAEGLPEELKTLMATVRAQSGDKKYTNYLRVVGELFLINSKGNRIPLKGILPPSFDFKVGREADMLENQIHLVSAVNSDDYIQWETTSVEFYGDAAETLSEEDLAL